MKDTVLVTGASGFVGRHLVRALRERGERVVAYSTRDGDLSQSAPEVTGIRHVFHLAARTFVPDSWNDPRSFYQTNVLGTVNVLEFCRREGSSLTLLSSYVYGQPRQLPIPEDHPLHAFNPYGHSKILAEQVVRFYGEAFQVPVTIVRAFNLYGPGQADHFLIPSIIRQALAPDTEAIKVEDADPKRDYIFISDLIELLVALYDRGVAGIYNAGSGVSFSVQEVADLAMRIAGTDKRVLSRGRRRQDEVMDMRADISRARTEAGWSPKVTLEEGLRRTMEAFRESAAEAAR